MADPDIIGLKELGDKLDLLSENVQKKHVRTAIKPASEVFRRAVRAKAPVRDDQYAKDKNKRKPRYLKRHIGRWIKPEKDGGLSAFVGPTPSAYYGRFVELGTGHQSAHPFMRPAYDEKKDEAEKTFADTLEVEIDKDLK